MTTKAVVMTTLDEIGSARKILETIGSEMPTILFDPVCLSDEGVDEVNRIRALYRDQKMMIMPLPLEWLRELYVFVPPDQLALYKAGLPIFVAAVQQETRAKNPTHRPMDGAIVKAAKAALDIETFRLVGRQKAVELAANNRRTTLTPAEAESRAKVTIVAAIRQGYKRAGHRDKKFNIDGAIDGGRRLAAWFFRTRRASDRCREDAREVKACSAAATTAVLPFFSADNRQRALGMAWNEQRTVEFDGAMTRWDKSANGQQQISTADALSVTNAFETRMTAPALLKVAISGDLDPSVVHKNLHLERPKFQLGLLLGRLHRGRTVEMTSEHADILQRAISTVQRGIWETQGNVCDAILVEAAGKHGNLAFWQPVLERILATGLAELIAPKNPVAPEEK